jgi:DNA-binding transcriptional MerR regulator
MGTLTISTLAKQVGIRPDTIRYYERAGLLPPPLRSPAGYRQYDQTTVDRVRFIRGAQRLGLRLREIADLLAVRDRGSCPCGHAEALVRQRISELDAEIARLVDVRHELTRLADDCAAGACRNGVWPCEAEFIQAGRR